VEKPTPNPHPKRADIDAISRKRSVLGGRHRSSEPSIRTNHTGKPLTRLEAWLVEIDLGHAQLGIVGRRKPRHISIVLLDRPAGGLHY
jgi:hypothetical protein